MNIEQTELYERIQAFALDRSDAQLAFSTRLAKDNGWTLAYAQQAIEEYKKFAFWLLPQVIPLRLQTKSTKFGIYI